MILNETHRKLLGMRTYLNKFAVQVGYDPDSDFMKALEELIQDGYVKKIDTYFNREIGCILDVYKLTPEGDVLVLDENIIAVSP